MNDKDREELINKLAKGEIRPYRLSDLVSNENEAVEIRNEYLQKAYGLKLTHVAKTSIDFNDAGKRNIENAIGAVQMPLGYVEILVNGDYAKSNGKKFPVFLATTEGKLVAGVNRGAMAVNKSGGATTKILKSSMTRSVILDTGSVVSSLKAAEYINSKEGKKLISDEFSKTSKHGEFKEVETYSTGRLLFIRYGADTKAAMGMNMVTIASSKATEKMVEKLSSMGVKAKFVSESGNLCSDKKPSAINILKGRGVSVIAEAVIKKEVIEEYFKVDANSIAEINYVKNYVGSSLAVSLAHNAHAANILAATFIAYGQDVAQIVDAVNALDDVKAEANGDLYISVYLPSLEIGTYGGGTGRETQRELLAASGVYGEGDDKGVTKFKLAEIIASTVLAGELNLLAAEAGNELGRSHASLKR